MDGTLRTIRPFPGEGKTITLVCMCGRYVQSRSVEDLERFLKPDLLSPDLPHPSWNIKPTDQISVLLTDRKNKGIRRLHPARWALTPHWSPTLKTRSPLFNARIESVLETPSFRESVKNRRCVIPACGYYEWTGDRDNRIPHYLRGSRPLLFAGLTSWWHDPVARPDEGWVLTATILTTDSYGPMERIHNRIPVFMTDALIDEWLSPDLEADEAFLDAVSEQSLSVGVTLSEHEVKPLRGDGPHLIDPAIAA